MRSLGIVVLLTAILYPVFGQNVSLQPEIDPPFFRADEEITITYDVTGTALQDLETAYIWFWLPEIGVDAPSNINPASSNTAATDPAKFTVSEINGRKLFSINLNPADFTNTPADQISRVGMLMKGDNWSNGQTEDYLADITSEFSVRLDSPEGNFDIVSEGTVFDIKAVSSDFSVLTLLIDNDTLASESNANSIEASHTAISDGASHTIQVVANLDGSIATDNFSYIAGEIVTPVKSLPPGMKAGINYHADSATVTLVLDAPNKENVFVLGDFNDWLVSNNYLMNQDGDVYWLTLENLDKSTEYYFQYLVDTEIHIADPYTEKVISPFDDGEIIEENRYPGLKPYPVGKAQEAVSVIRINKPHFEWEDHNYQRPAKEDLVIYELLVRDFTEERTYQAVIDRLDYLDSLGINAIQLMPVMEFEGNLSWGYNPAFLFAVDKYYGTENDLKRLINESHKRGMAVILDIVLNHHFGRSSLVRLYNQGTYGNPTADNPWFNVTPKHDFNVGYDFNHESVFTQEYMDEVVKYWVREYHVDGYRFDLSKGLTQKNTLGNVGAWGALDQTRIDIWDRLSKAQWSVDPDSYVILEHFADNAEEKVLSDMGMMLWGNHNHDYRNAAKAFVVDLGWIDYTKRGWNDPHLIGYMESHDEERVAWDILNIQNKAYQMERLKLNAVFCLLVPGPKMLWQFGEFGYDEELNNDRLGIKPTKWEYLDDPYRQGLFSVYQSLINLKTNTNLLDSEGFSWKSTGFIKWIRHDNANTDVFAIGNFNIMEEAAELPFIPEGTWYNYFTGEEIVFEGQAPYSFTLPPGGFVMMTSEPVDNYLSDGASVFLDISNEELKIKVYPNPIMNRLNVTGSDINKVTIMDINGKEVFMKTFRNLDIVEMQTDYLDSGIYFIQVETANGIYQHKILKM